MDLGSPLDFTSRNGMPATLGMLYIMALNGTPFTYRVTNGIVNADGDWDDGGEQVLVVTLAKR